MKKNIDVQGEINISIPSKSCKMIRVDKQIRPKKNFNEFGEHVFLEFDNDFSLILSEKKGLILMIPKKYFKRQFEDIKREYLEFSFSPMEAIKIFNMYNYYAHGKKFEKGLIKDSIEKGLIKEDSKLLKTRKPIRLCFDWGSEKKVKKCQQ